MWKLNGSLVDYLSPKQNTCKTHKKQRCLKALLLRWSAVAIKAKSTSYNADLVDALSMYRWCIAIFKKRLHIIHVINQVHQHLNNYFKKYF